MMGCIQNYPFTFLALLTPPSEYTGKYPVGKFQISTTLDLVSTTFPYGVDHFAIGCSAH